MGEGDLPTSGLNWFCSYMKIHGILMS